MFARLSSVAACALGVLGGAETAWAQRIDGPGEAVEIVQALSVDYYEIEFSGQGVAEVFLVGDGGTDLDVFVYDEKGRLVAQDIGPTDIAYCTWRPAKRGTYRIEVRNLGIVWNEYSIITN